MPLGWRARCHLAIRSARPTAVVAFNDLIAIGLMQAASARGMRVPDDLSIAGFDDIFGSELIVPPLTTVRSRLVEAGERAVRGILARTNQAPSPDGGLLQTELVVRGSTGPAAS